MEGLESEIVSFYKNKTIFLTGGSGFVGRVFIEKLLRVTEVHRIYVLIRPKRGKEIQDRIADWSSDLLFEKLLQANPNALQKVVAIAGDCQEPDLGISLVDRQLLTDQVQLVVHSAASVRFVEPLHVALDINTRATRLMLQLAKEMKHLEAFVYVSTAFSNCVTHHIEEMFYPDHLSCSVDKVLQLREMLDDDVIDRMAPALQNKFPNTYTYTKALSEQLIQTESDHLPTCVFRPGAILASDKEPVSGYIDNIYGPIAVVYGVAHGFLRIVPLNCELPCPSIPVDTCVNLLLSCCWKTAKVAAQGNRQSPPAIYNLVPHPKNPFKSGDFVNYGNRHRLIYPLENSIWYPFAIAITTPWLYNLAIIFYHLLPGYILDMLLRLQGKKPRLIKLYDKVHKNMAVLAYFLQTHWSYDISNSTGLWNSMNKADKQLFPFDMEFFDWANYFKRALCGMRLYLGKQDPSEESLERARKRMRRLRMCHWLLHIGLAFSILAIVRWLLLLWL